MPFTRFWDIFLVLRLFLPYCLLIHSKQSLIRKIFYSLFKSYCFNIYIKLFILQKGLWKTLQKREMLKWTSRYPTRKYFIFSLLYDSFKSIILKWWTHRTCWTRRKSSWQKQRQEVFYKKSILKKGLQLY